MSVSVRGFQKSLGGDIDLPKACTPKAMEMAMEMVMVIVGVGLHCYYAGLLGCNSR